MPEGIDMKLEGAEKLRAVARELKRIGDTDLRKALTKAIRDATKPTKAAIKASALANLPKRGGLAVLIANSRITNKIKTGARTAGVTITAVNAHEIKSMDRGILRHPVFGDRHVWKTQTIAPGWFSKPIEENGPEVQKQVGKAVDDIAHSLKL
jgi:hypothetical protein